jgi:hypothetical protein
VRITFKSLVELDEFQSACSEAGYSAFWDSEIKAVVMEDAVGRHCFRAGTRASVVMDMLKNTPPSKVFDELLVPLMET